MRFSPRQAAGANLRAKAPTKEIAKLTKQQQQHLASLPIPIRYVVVVGLNGNNLVQFADLNKTTICLHCLHITWLNFLLFCRPNTLFFQQQ